MCKCKQVDPRLSAKFDKPPRYSMSEPVIIMGGMGWGMTYFSLEFPDIIIECEVKDNASIPTTNK